MEFIEADFISIPIKIHNAARFIGPPPMPKNAEITPKVKPNININTVLLIGFFKLTPLFTKMIIIIKSSIKTIFCITDTVLSLFILFIAALKRLVPKTPPKAAPKPKFIDKVRLNFVLAKICFVIDETAIKNTPQVDKKLIFCTLKSVKASNTGFKITPPPRPDNDPIPQAIKAIKK